MMKDKLMNGKELLKRCKRLKGKIVEIIKHVNGRFDSYSISPKIRQILLHWGYEIVKSDFFFCSYKNDFLLV